MPTAHSVVRFYSVQDERDRRRLEGGGEPWPTAPERAFLGSGFYARESAEDANAYRTRLVTHGAGDVEVLTFEIEAGALARLRSFEVTALSDADANNWLYT